MISTNLTTIIFYAIYFPGMMYMRQIGREQFDGPATWLPSLVFGALAFLASFVWNGFWRETSRP